MKRKREILALPPWVLSIQTLNRTHLQSEAARLQPPLMRQRGVSLKPAPVNIFMTFLRSQRVQTTEHYCIFVSLFIILEQTDAHLDHEQCFNLIPRKPWGRAVSLGGEGQGSLMFFLSKTVAMLIKLNNCTMTIFDYKYQNSFRFCFVI